MLFVDVVRGVEVGNGTGNLEDAVIGARREPQTVGDQFQHAVSVGIQFAIPLDEAWRHLGITVDFGAVITFQLQFPRPFHPPGNVGGAFCFATVGQVTVFDGRYFDVDIDAIQQWSGDAGAVALNGDRGAAAGMNRIGQVAAGAGVC